MKKYRPRKENKAKNIIIIVLCVLLAVESVAFAATSIFKNEPKTEIKEAPIELRINLSGATAEIGNAATELLNKFSENGISPSDITGLVRKVIYSDLIVNTIMSMAYPLLFQVLTNLEMMDFAENIDLYPTGPSYAKKLEGTSYTCCDKDGTRKPLTEVLNNVGSDWTYMDTTVSWTDSDSVTKTTTLWNTIKWGVTDKESFYNAMAVMSEGLRGVLEICVQSKERTVNINVVDFLLHTDSLPINLDAAKIYNSSEKSGYEICLLTLFNALGLVEGEYPAPETVCSYTNLGDIWKAILDPVLLAVDKAVNDPVSKLTDMLINFAAAIDTGALVNSMRSLKMDGDFHDLATTVMGFQDGEIYNLGNSLIEIIGEMGIDISGSFNNLLDGLLKLISKSENADMPDMNMEKLFSCATVTTRANGRTYYISDSQKTVDFLVEYVINEKIIESVLTLTPLNGTPEAQTIVSAIGQSKEGLTTIAKTLVGIVLGKLDDISK